jgi:hypothetical protein
MIGKRTRATRNVLRTGRGSREKLVRRRENIEEEDGLAEEAGWDDGEAAAVEEDVEEVGIEVVGAVEGSGFKDRRESSSRESTRGFCCELRPGLVSGLSGGIIGDFAIER